MTTVRKGILEFQPSDDVLRQIVTSAQCGNHETVRRLLKQSIRPRSKKEALQSSSSSAQYNWNERLVLLQLYVTTKSAEGEAEHSAEAEEETPVGILSDWKTAATPSAQIYRLLHAYQFYQQQNYSKVVHLYLQQKEIPIDTSESSPIISKKIHLAWEHLYAQSLHHVQNGTAALQVYQEIFSLLKHPSPLSFRLDQVLQLYTNYVAIVLSYFTIPYCPTTNTAGHQNDNEIMTQIRQSVMLQLSKQGREQDTSSSHAMIASLYIDLGYNVATYYLLSAAGTLQERQEWLQVLFSYCNNNVDDKCTFKDQFSSRLNHKLFREYFWNLSSSMMKRTNFVSYGDNNEQLFSNINAADGLAHLSLQQQLVYRMNDTMLSLQQSVSSFGMTQSSSPERILQSLISEYNAAAENSNHKCSVLTNLQLHIVHYNIAVYQYYCKQYASCQQTCQHYFLSTSNNSKSIKKKKKSTTTNGTDSCSFEVINTAQYQTPDEKFFWESRATVMLSYCAVATVSVSSPTTTAATIEEKDTTIGRTSDIGAPLGDDIIKALSSAVEMLNPFCELPTTNDHSIEVCNHVVLYARLHQYALRAKLSNEHDSSSNVSLHLLESLPEPIRSKPAVQSIILQQQKRVLEQSKHDSNLQQAPIDEKPTLSKLLDMVQSLETSKFTQSSNGKDWQRYVLFADFAVSHKRYADATALYEAVINSGKFSGSSDNTTMMANYVRALSHVRPNDAIAVWSGISNSIATVPDLIPSDTNNVASASELEMKEITFHSSMNNMQSTADVSEETTNKKKKSHDAVLRQRAKKRETYLQHHQKANGTAGTILPQQPDPERWLPKYERSSYAKYRRNYKKGSGGVQQASQSKSSQGIVSAQDMAKLDVVAHQAATAAAMAADGPGTTDGSTIAALRSTAHMNVSNKGRGKKRR